MPSFHVVNCWHFSYCEELHHGPFAENVTALIKMWCFSRKRFITLGGKKKQAPGAALYKEKCKRTFCLKAN